MTNSTSDEREGTETEISLNNNEAPATIWLSRGNTRGSWEFSGCWGVHPFAGIAENVQYQRVDLPTKELADTDKEALKAIAAPWICVEENPCEETIAVHWDELIAALAGALSTARQKERAAERKRVLDVIKRVPATAAGADAFRKRLIEELYVEAAANETREDGDDG